MFQLRVYDFSKQQNAECPEALSQVIEALFKVPLSGRRRILAEFHHVKFQTSRKKSTSQRWGRVC